MSITSLSANLGLSTYINSDVQPFKEKEKNEEAEVKEAVVKTTAEEFLEFARMNPAERIRAAYLKEKGLTEEDLAAMPKEEREKIEEEIRELIEKKVRKGLPEDVTGLDIQA